MFSKRWYAGGSRHPAYAQPANSPEHTARLPAAAHGGGATPHAPRSDRGPVMASRATHQTERPTGNSKPARAVFDT